MRNFINKNKIRLFTVVITLGLGSSAFSAGWDVNDLAKPCEAFQEHVDYWKSKGVDPLVGDPVKTLVLAPACLLKTGKDAFLAQFGKIGTEALKRLDIIK